MKPLLAAAAVLLAAGCGAVHEAPSPSSIRVAYARPPNFDDLPSLVAHERLRQAGYRVEEVIFALSEQTAEALARGDVDFASGAMRTFWAARSRGADVVTLMAHLGNVHRLVARVEVTRCEQLADRRVALHTEGATGTALFRAYLAEACPGVAVQTLMVPRSENRAAALLSGRFDVAVLELSLVGWLHEQAPDQFHILDDFGARWPTLEVTGVHVRGSLLEARPDLVHDYLRARLEADRQVVANPARLIEEAVRAIGPSPAWAGVMQAYVDAGMWRGDGRLTWARVEESLAFFQRREGLNAGLTARDVANLEMLEHARRTLAPPSGVPTR
jgi:ABC-type nitrate/sulfonate/bicarbonate transport system substrate-binding protein